MNQNSDIVLKDHKIFFVGGVDFKKNNNQILSFYDPKKFDDNISEIFYLFSNLYKQRDDEFSNLLLSLSLEFNDRFLSNHLASFENHLSDSKSKNFNYLLISKLKNIGSEYRWYIDYQIAIHEGKENIKFLILVYLMKNV